MNNNLFVLNQDTLNDLKNNINFEDYNNQDNSAFLERLNVTSIPTVTPLIVSDTSKKSIDDLENSIKLYETWKYIPLSLASDERFWVFLTHAVYWDYMQLRWPLSEVTKDKVNHIKARYFFNSKDKNFYRSGLSRLWWYAHLTYDATKEDPYYFTKLILLNQDNAGQLIENTNLSRNKVALQAVLKALKDFYDLKDSGTIETVSDIRNTIVRPLMKYVNLIGGVTIWDVFTEDEAYNKAWKFIESKIVRLAQPIS